MEQKNTPAERIPEYCEKCGEDTPYTMYVPEIGFEPKNWRMVGLHVCKDCDKKLVADEVGLEPLTTLTVQQWEEVLGLVQQFTVPSGDAVMSWVRLRREPDHGPFGGHKKMSLGKDHCLAMLKLGRKLGLTDSQMEAPQ